MSDTDSSKRRRFAIALSFPGERREYVEQVANALLPMLSRVNSFYPAPRVSGDRSRGTKRVR